MSPSVARLKTPNRAFQNGLTSNGLFQNGLFQNGLFQNGLFQNGLFQNGLFQNGLFQNGLWQANPAAREILRTNAYTREFLTYLYQCAMPEGVSTTIDPRVISPPGVDPPIVDLEAADLTLRGLIGLAPEWQIEGGGCGESCQRWLSACLLARTNAYDAQVDISMRVPDDAPPHVKEALKPAPESGELEAFTLREGAYYGNLFRQVEQPSDDGLPVTVMAPTMHACAGPGSNIPDVTKRFCSSQGAGGPIRVAGTCEPHDQFPWSACLGVSGDPKTGAMRDCYTGADPANRGEHYPEAITVYLKKPIEVCNNSVCEANEASEGSCPSDCHPGGWTRSFKGFLSGSSSAESQNHYPFLTSSWVRTSALGPDDTIVLAGVAPSTIDVGGGPLDLGPDGQQYGVLAKYGPDGQHLWSRRFGLGFNEAVSAASVAVAPDGSIGVLLGENDRMWLAKFGPDDGPLLWSEASVPLDEYYGITTKALASDRDGNLIVSGKADGRSTFGSMVVGFGNAEREFVLKISPQGVPQWTDYFTNGVSFGSKTIATDRDGNVLVTLEFNARGALWKLDAATGATVWKHNGFYGGVAAGPNGNVYVTGALERVDAFGYEYPFEVPPTAGRGNLFVAEYAAADGAPLHVRFVGPACDAEEGPCGGTFEGRDVAFDAAGNVVVGALGGGAPIDFGAGLFRTYATQDVFVAAFSPALEPLWSKHVPMVLGGIARGLHLDGRGRVVLSGTFSGSMLVDDRMLVSNLPEQADEGNTFLAAFSIPPASDNVPPVVEGQNLPQPMTLEATSAAGAEVFYTLPTSFDTGYAGVSVECTPPPNSVFPLGTKTVRCTSTDPLGNQSSASFSVTVLDHLGPAFSQVPAPVVVDHEGPTGAIVTYALPLAIDLVDGTRTVACEPKSGSLFPIGTTPVVCSSTDAQNHQTQATFGVTVVDRVPPVLTVPAPIEATATSSQGALITYAASAADGIDGPIAATCSPPSGSMFAPGSTTVTCSATDAAGNTATAAFPVAVTYAWSNVLKPINVEGNSAFKFGTKVSVNFRLVGASAPITDLPATLTAVNVADGAAPRAPSAAVVSDALAFHYDPSTGRYEHLLLTRQLSRGYWDLHFDFGDGMPRSVRIRLW